ncbi:molybdate ABC transporter substrate-binding protein [Rhodoligotrophos ferricapiens]|uniref:molybdate ABC transporter substrate-binding protein n=1 Tax=Rhodoligotrophos ferricapiens TaxID=3069264 RepID=UPI00315D339C
MIRGLIIAILAACSLVGGAAGSPARAQEVTIFAAASLTDALEALGRAYAAKSGGALRFSFASSSTLARQIEAGAPAQIFISADEKWMDYVTERGLVAQTTRVSPIGNELVLIAPTASDQGPVAISTALDIAGLLGGDGRLSVGDPEHVPAGIYAKEALTRLGLWTSVEAKLARGDNVRAALALVERGEAPLGIVYGTDAQQSVKVKIIGRFPAEASSAITYPFAIVKGQDTPEVKKAFAFITGPDALTIYKEFGFSVN